jgi:hypothetical protein
MYAPQSFRGIFPLVITCGNMDGSTYLALHFTGTIINEIHNLFYHFFTCSVYFSLIQILYRWWSSNQKYVLRCSYSRPVGRSHIIGYVSNKAHCLSCTVRMLNTSIHMARKQRFPVCKLFAVSHFILGDHIWGAL